MQSLDIFELITTLCNSILLTYMFKMTKQEISKLRYPKMHDMSTLILLFVLLRFTKSHS